MALIKNIDAEFGANYVANSSLATGLAGITFSSQSAGGPVVAINRTVLGNVSNGPLVSLDIGSSASVPAIQLVGQSFVSAVSIVFAAGAGWAGLGAVRVLLSDGQTFGWIPVLPSAVVTAAARG